MWPLFFSGHFPFYPGVSHARIMIEVFAGGFVVGFLGIARPRMLSSPRIQPWELVLYSDSISPVVCAICAD